MKHRGDNYKIKAFEFEKYIEAAALNRDDMTTKRHLVDNIRSTPNSLSVTSINTLKAKKLHLPLKDTLCSYTFDQMSASSANISSKQHLFNQNETFGQKETAVYMTYLDDFRHRTAGTQATAAINKCFQVGRNNGTGSYCASTCCTNIDIPFINTPSTTTTRDDKRHALEKNRYPEVYFFGSKKDKSKGMGSSGSKESEKGRKPKPTDKDVTAANVSLQSVGGSSTRTQSKSTTCGSLKPARGSCAATCTGKAVSIKDDKCPASSTSKGEMMATISHIRIGPKEPCPVHGPAPCQGPKCIVATSGEDPGPVKVSTVTNPRRGVFELVIRRMTGAPLAKNELMLEWTPPPSRPPCGTPCGPMPCAASTPCRISKCKMIVCRASPCKPKICRKGCKRPCRPVPCRPVPCERCCKSPCPPSPCRPCPPPKCGGCGGCGSGCSQCPATWPCRPLPPWRYKTCSPYPCKPCPPTSCRSCSLCQPRPCPRPCSPLSPCKPCRPCKPCKPCLPPPVKSPCPSLPCRKPCCASPCSSSPCILPCPRRKRPRKSRSSPKIRARRKRISPCCNRSKYCPVVRCRSLPGPCIVCGSFPCCL